MCPLLLSTTTFTTPLSSVPLKNPFFNYNTIINFLSFLYGHYEANLSLCTYRSFFIYVVQDNTIKKVDSLSSHTAYFWIIPHNSHTFVVVQLFA